VVLARANASPLLRAIHSCHHKNLYRLLGCSTGLALDGVSYQLKMASSKTNGSFSSEIHRAYLFAIRSAACPQRKPEASAGAAPLAARFLFSAACSSQRSAQKNVVPRPLVEHRALDLRVVILDRPLLPDSS